MEERKNNETIVKAGTIVEDDGKYKCTVCGLIINLKAGEELPICPKCGSKSFRKI